MAQLIKGVFLNRFHFHGAHTRTDFPSVSIEPRKKSPIDYYGDLYSIKTMAWFDPYYNEFPVERELVYYVASIIEDRGEKHDRFGRAVWGENGGKTWRTVRNTEPSYNEEKGEYKKPRRISIEEVYKMAKALDREVHELVKEAVIRYERKAQKGATYHSRSTPPPAQEA